MKVGGKKNVKIENDKLKMWKLNPKAEVPEDWEDSLSEGQLSEDFADNASDSQKTTLEDVTDDDGQELEDEEAAVIN